MMGRLVVEGKGGPDGPFFDGKKHGARELYPQKTVAVVTGK
jgi:hypothetical protein